MSLINIRLIAGGLLATILVPFQLQAQRPAVAAPKATPAAVIPPAPTSASRISFQAAGYDDQTIQGLSGSSAYYLRLPATATLQNGQLVLFMKPSQALQLSQSSVTVLVRNQPALSLRLDQLEPNAPVTIPLSEASRDAGSPFVQVEIKTQLNITNDRCKDLENPALWLRVSGASFVTYNPAANGAQRLNLSNCLPSKEAIVYPVNPTPNDIQLVSALYSRLFTLRPRGVALYAADKAPDSLRNVVVVGEVGNLPARYKALLTRQPQAGQGLFFLQKGVAAGSEVLFVTGADQAGYAKTVGAIANPNILASAFGDFLIIDKAAAAAPAVERTDRLTLAQLGGTPDMMQGIGSLRRSYSFRLSDFAEQPGEIETHLEARYSGLQPGDRGFLNLYINGVLFSTTTLDKSGLVSISPRLKRYLLKPFNALQAEFRFFPGTNVCQNSFLNFFAQVDVQRSSIRLTSPYSTEQLSFLQFPGAFQNKPIALVVSKSQLVPAIPGICEVVRQLNIGNTSQPAFLSVPAVYTSEAYAKGDSTKGNLIAFLDRGDNLWGQFDKAPVQFQRDFRLYSDDRSRPLFAVSDSVSCGVAQVFEQGDQAVLLMAVNGTSANEAFRNAARYVTDQLTNLASNVLITAGTNRYLFNLTEDQSVIDYNDGFGKARDWWQQYNLYVLGVLLILVLLAFLYVRSKVKGSQAIFEN